MEDDGIQLEDNESQIDYQLTFIGQRYRSPKDLIALEDLIIEESQELFDESSPMKKRVKLLLKCFKMSEILQNNVLSLTFEEKLEFLFLHEYINYTLFENTFGFEYYHSTKLLNYLKMSDVGYNTKDGLIVTDKEKFASLLKAKMMQTENLYK